MTNPSPLWTRRSPAVAADHTGVGDRVSPHQDLPGFFAGCGVTRPACESLRRTPGPRSRRWDKRCYRTPPADRPATMRWRGKPCLVAPSRTLSRAAASAGVLASAPVNSPAAPRRIGAAGDTTASRRPPRRRPARPRPAGRCDSPAAEGGEKRRPRLNADGVDEDDQAQVRDHVRQGDVGVERAHASPANSTAATPKRKPKKPICPATYPRPITTNKVRIGY